MKMEKIRQLRLAQHNAKSQLHKQRMFHFPLTFIKKKQPCS